MYIIYTLHVMIMYIIMKITVACGGIWIVSCLVIRAVEEKIPLHTSQNINLFLPSSTSHRRPARKTLFLA